MRNGLIPIGKMAKINRVSVPTLRLYDEMGLLKPRFVDAETGYRYYDIDQNARLDMIAYMKELGMSLTEIGEALSKEDIALIEELLAQKNEQLHEQMRQLKARHDAVERAIQSIERYRKSPVTGTLSLEYIDRRYIWGIPCSDNFYQRDIYCYEREVAELREALAEKGLSQIHSYNIGTSISQENFVRGDFAAENIFIFAGHSISEQQQDFQIVDSGMYACIYVDNYDDEIPCAEMLRKYCIQNKYRISGDYICEVMTGFHVFDHDPCSMFLRLQVPVTFQK